MIYHLVKRTAHRKSLCDRPKVKKVLLGKMFLHVVNGAKMRSSSSALSEAGKVFQISAIFGQKGQTFRGFEWMKYVYISFIDYLNDVTNHLKNCSFVYPGCHY